MASTRVTRAGARYFGYAENETSKQERKRVEQAVHQQIKAIECVNQRQSTQE